MVMSKLLRYPLRHLLFAVNETTITEAAFQRSLRSPRSSAVFARAATQEDGHVIACGARHLSSLAGQGPHVLASPYKENYNVLEVPLHELVMKNFDKYGNNIALVDGQTGRSYTYNQLTESVRRVGSALTRMGFRQGDVLCLFSHNVPEYAVLFLAVSAIGGVVSAANPLYTVDELEKQLCHSNSKLIACSTMGIHCAQMAKSRCPHVKDIIVFGEAEGCRSFSSLLQEDDSAFPENISLNPREDLVALPYSSGTTGLPKGVMLTHYSIGANVQQLSQPDIMQLANKYNEPATFVAILPFFHIYGQVVTMLLGLYSGSKVVTLPRFEPEVFLDTIQKYKVTMANLVPPIVLFMAKHPLVSKYDLSSLHEVTCGAAPISKELVDEFLSNTNVPSFKQAYGLTETSPVTHCLPIGSTKYHSIGCTVGHTQCKIVDLDSGESVRTGSLGELCIRGPQVMKGYLNNPEATADTIDADGWLHTGDIGYSDEDGFIVIKDRLKELIKYKGFQVPPAELEGLLLTHPAVQDSAVIGVPDEEAGELPRAYVVAKKGHKLTETDVLEFVNMKVAPSKKLRAGVHFVDEIPKTASGKILRRVLKGQMLKELGKA